MYIVFEYLTTHYFVEYRYSKPRLSRPEASRNTSSNSIITIFKLFADTRLRLIPSAGSNQRHGSTIMLPILPIFLLVGVQNSEEVMPTSIAYGNVSPPLPYLDKLLGSEHALLNVPVHSNIKVGIDNKIHDQLAYIEACHKTILYYHAKLFTVEPR